MDDTVAEAAFHQLRGAGALLVSGSRSAGETSFLRVESLPNDRALKRGGTNVTLVPPNDWLGKKTLVASPVSVQISAGSGGKPQGSLSFTLAPGESVVLYASDAKPNDFTIRPAAGEEKFFNWWGM